MIDVTDTIKNGYEKSTTQYDKIVLDNKEYVINNVEPDDDCYENGNIFGTAIAKSLSFEIDNSVDLEGKEFEYYTGIKTNAGIEWIKLGTFITQDVEPNDTTKINKVNAMDYMLKTNIEYISELEYSSNNITLLQVAQEACSKSGLVLATTDFPNASFIVDSNQFEQGTLIRQVIQAIAQISGSVAKVRSDDKLYLITPKTTGDVKKVFDLNDYSEIEIKRATHPINLVSLGMSDVEGENVVLRDEQSILLDGENSLVINDNPFAYTEAKRQQLITAIFNAVKGFEYKSFTLKGQYLPYLETLDNIQIKDLDGNTYNSFLFRFYGKSPKGLETEMSAPSLTKATVNYQNVATAEQIAKRTEFKVDKQEQKIQALTTSNTELVKKTAKLEVAVDKIEGEISEVADVTVTADGYGTLNVENINQSEPIMIRIYPTSEDITPLRPKVGLYPRVGLRPHNRELIFERTDNEEEPYKIEYNIPKDLYKLDNYYDEFILDYENQRCYINRNIGIDENGEKYLLEIPTVEEYEYPTLQLLEGDYKISLPAFPNAYIYVRLMTANIYTSQFATKVELNSKLEQTSNSFNIMVDQKLSDYSTTQEMNSAISVSAGNIMNSVSGTYATKNSLNQVNQTLTASLELKINTEDLISEINASADQIKLKAGRLIITSGNFLLDENGNMTVTNANIKGNIKAGSTISGASIQGSSILAGSNNEFYVSSKGAVRCKNLGILSTTDNSSSFYIESEASNRIIRFTPSLISMNNENQSETKVSLSHNGTTGHIYCFGGIEARGSLGTVSADGSMFASNFVNTSEKSAKQNIIKLNSNSKNKKITRSGLDIIKNSDICEFEYKEKEDTNIGLVIGDGFSAPEEIIKEYEVDGKKHKGIDQYGMSSIAWKAIQELSEKVDKLEKGVI